MKGEHRFLVLPLILEKSFATISERLFLCMRSIDSFKELIHRVNYRLCIHGETFGAISFILLGELYLFYEELCALIPKAFSNL